MLRIPFQEVQSKLAGVLRGLAFSEARAELCARLFAETTRDGVYSHGVNRFARFVAMVRNRSVDPAAEPKVVARFGSLQRWDGQRGPGNLNAWAAMEQAVVLGREHGIGCVAMANTNHWMRGGTYGWQAAKEGFVFIGWTNTTAIMPTWGAIDARLGNNPLVFALPYKEEAIVLDMAMSQFSYGAMELAVLKNENLPVAGGYNNAGELSNDAAAILASKRPLPVGYWKGAGLSLLLDILATVLSAGLSTHEITTKDVEYCLSQVFIAIDISKLGNHSLITKTVEGIIDNYHQSVPVDASKKITYPGQRVLSTRKIILPMAYR